MVSKGGALGVACPLLKHLPKVKPIGNCRQDQKQLMDRSRFEEAVNLLWNHPEIRADAVTSMLQCLAAISEKDRAAQDAFDVQTKDFGHLDETWMPSFI
eukprot:9778383-Lingulodinium_polyedra.AAC.1